MEIVNITKNEMFMNLISFLLIILNNCQLKSHKL